MNADKRLKSNAIFTGFAQEPFQPENALTLTELLKAWTFGRPYKLDFETKLGTLKKGKLADIAVLNSNPFQTPLEDIRDSKVCLTLVNSNIVYTDL